MLGFSIAAIISSRVAKNLACIFGSKFEGVVTVTSVVVAGNSSFNHCDKPPFIIPTSEVYPDI
jgi:hypothetical protein